MFAGGVKSASSGAFFRAAGSSHTCTLPCRAAARSPTAKPAQLQQLRQRQRAAFFGEHSSTRASVECSGLARSAPLDRGALIVGFTIAAPCQATIFCVRRAVAALPRARRVSRASADAPMLLALPAACVSIRRGWAAPALRTVAKARNLRLPLHCGLRVISSSRRYARPASVISILARRAVPLPAAASLEMFHRPAPGSIPQANARAQQRLRQCRQRIEDLGDLPEDALSQDAGLRRRLAGRSRTMPTIARLRKGTTTRVPGNINSSSASGTA